MNLETLKQKLPTLTPQQKQLSLAALVVIVAILFGYVLGRRPATDTTMTGTETNTEQTGSGTNSAGTASGAAGNAPTTGGTTTGGTATTPTTTTGTTTKPSTGSDTPIAAPAKTGLISLAAQGANGGISFNWNLPANLTSPFGFVIYKSTSSNPSFPRDEHKFISNPNVRTYTWDIQDGKAYWFRLCTWNGKTQQQSGCLTTSNAVKATAPTASASQQANPFDFTETELGLAGRGENDGVRLFWSQSTSAKFVSYKVVRSATDTNPYYPKTPAVVTLNNKTDVGAFDNTATKGAKYWYRVCVVRSDANPQCGNVWTIQY